MCRPLGIQREYGEQKDKHQQDGHAASKFVRLFHGKLLFHILQVEIFRLKAGQKTRDILNPMKCNCRFKPTVTRQNEQRQAPEQRQHRPHD